MKYYIGADLGTSAMKLLLTDENGTIVNTATRSYEVIYPKSGWSEQNPSDWWGAFIDGVKELIALVDADCIRAIAVAGQMHGLVALDKADQVIRPAILWNDGRTWKQTAYLNEVIGKQKMSGYTANIAFAGFTAPKLLWMCENEKALFDRIDKIMLPKDYMNYKLTGVHATDYSDASGMLLLDVEHKCWSKSMIEICSIREEMLPKLFESYEPIGTLLPSVAEELGLSQSVTVAAGAGDNAAAAIGTGTVGEGRCNISLGTSGTVFISSSHFGVDENNALHSFCHADGNYHLMGCMLSAASCNKWFCDQILHSDAYAKEQERIDRQKLGKNQVFFLPYLMGERSPINDTDASGVFIGLRPDTAREDMLLSILEGVAFAVRDNVEVAKKIGISLNSSTVCGGGARSALWVEILSNVLNLELQIPSCEEGPGYGAAMLAMTACGDCENVSEKAKYMLSIRETVKPTEKLVALYEEQYCKFTKIYPSLKALYQELNT